MCGSEVGKLTDQFVKASNVRAADDAWKAWKAAERLHGRHSFINQSEDSNLAMLLCAFANNLILWSLQNACVMESVRIYTRIQETTETSIRHQDGWGRYDTLREASYLTYISTTML